jgi:predicted 3-demethylubiquinone-9 3-methyltransferase (glyoxalase superfamily)
MAENTIAKNTICVWYDKDAEAAARFYAQTFPDSSVAPCIVRPVTTHPARRATC